MDLPARITALSDIAAVSLCEQLASELLQQRGIVLTEGASLVPPTVTGGVDLAALCAELDDTYHTKLPPDVSVRLAREMLLAAADDPTTAPVLTALLEARRDTLQFALEVLALGAALSMVILSATVTVDKGRVGKKALT